MIYEDKIELFILKCASLKIAVGSKHVAPELSSQPRSSAVDEDVSPFIEQFPSEIRQNAFAMSDHYKLFHMLENDIRRLIDDTLQEKYGKNWWEKHAPSAVKEECKSNQQREKEAAVTARSENQLDYVTFGHLGDIIRAHWDIFGGILSNQKALGRVMFALNVLRGPIAHCGLLAEDEISRLNITVKDWFRLLEGPK